MIIIKLRGGLGNQMFQYALARNMEILNNIEIKFDLSWFKRFPQRKYELDCFNIKENIASKKEVIKLRKFGRRDGRLTLIYNIFRNKNSSHIEEMGADFNPKILNIKDNTYLDGHFQSEKYFKNIENIIHKKFTLKNQTGKTFKKIKKQIFENNSISVHIRRGDYTTEKVQKTLCLCPLDYYVNAIKKIKSKINNPVFFIFSDNIEWAKNNFNINSPIIFVSGNSLKDCEELILMSKCKHNIIVNSSFSWWGAWLNNNPNKIVYAPKKWFNDETKNIKNLIPKSWIKV